MITCALNSLRLFLFLLLGVLQSNGGVEDLYHRYSNLIDDLPTGQGKFAWLLDQLMRGAHQRVPLTALVIGREAVHVAEEMDEATAETTQEGIPKAAPTEE